MQNKYKRFRTKFVKYCSLNDGDVNPIPIIWKGAALEQNVLGPSPLCNLDRPLVAHIA